MPRTTSRALALLAAGGVAAALALVPAGGANAAIATQFQAVASASASYTGTGGGSCTLTSGNSNVDSPVKAMTGPGTKKATVSLNAVFTNSLDSGDQVRVKGSYSAKVHVTNHKKDLASMTLSGTGKLATTTTKVFGSDCKASGVAVGETRIQFTEHKPGKLTLTRDTVNGALSLIEIVNVKTGKLVTLDFYQGDQSHMVSKASIKPGTYLVEEAVNGISVGNVGPILLKQGHAPKATHLKTALNLTFTPKK